MVERHIDIDIAIMSPPFILVVSTQINGSEQRRYLGNDSVKF